MCAQARYACMCSLIFKNDIQTLTQSISLFGKERKVSVPVAVIVLVFLSFILKGQFEIVLCVDSSESSSNRRSGV